MPLHSQSDAKQKSEAEQVAPSKEDVKAADQAADKATAPEVPEISQEIKGLLGLAYPDLMAVATTACDAWLKGRTQACSFLLYFSFFLLFLSWLSVIV